MEEKNKKLSYEELSKVASDLHVQYQKLMAEYRKAMETLQSRDFEYTSFFLSCLFKVVEHPEMYPEDFTKWAVDNIQGALSSFAESMKNAASGSAEAEKKTQGESE